MVRISLATGLIFFSILKNFGFYEWFCFNNLFWLYFWILYISYFIKFLRQKFFLKWSCRGPCLKHFCRFPSLLDRFFYTRWRWVSTWLADLILIGCEVAWIYKEKVTMFTILFWQFTKKWAPPSVEEIPALKLRSDLKVF